MQTKTRDIKAFITLYALCLGVQFLGNHFTMLGMGDWYGSLNKSPLTPPGYWFGIVWTVLYLMMAVAAWKVWHQLGMWNSRPLRWWMLQLFSGLLWCIIFFGHRDIPGGLAMIAAELVIFAATLHHFYRVNKEAGWLLVPQLVWLVFATYLNYYLFMHN